ncbi:T6SS effector BTH_I2691 family protein [Ralstonia pseudosolanacearum]|uniref:T6SS effector BTH_I2691 family protein n=1 Tax=Ralstonia pseudosolanacearum TaxID=1310165 RepID=UPI00267585B9|nr:T6SS effector BTH_I2691 family protein [Ralstonia pseudosolanacearum]MDO3563762.1 T6SS effector BTH_I2691 family protein [Ralstonia pseudosolanacearum]MDO3573441.1 T6SS effector BTH_I2691 family protein [Ralstonia pseudosolanacearum]MDO3614701.1 T6SS effector BTH_I2691 family protein [Ralstonia pseudosolanacearum]
MAEGQAISYSRNAQVAAASAKPACGASGCPSCVKAGLPVLLTRLGLADKGYAEARKGVLAPIVKKLAAPDLVASGYVLRTLRAGYVYAYYEKAHTPELVKQHGWQVFRVDHGGYLTPIPLAMAGKDDEAFTCKRSESYATAMLFVIPQPKQTKRVWVGFSTSPWSAPTLKKYASHADLRAKRMACIDAPAGKSEQAIGLTVEKAIQCIPDYDIGLKPEVLRGNPFPRLIPAKAGQSNGAAAVASPDAQDEKDQPVSPSKERPLALYAPPKQKVRPDDAQLLYKQAHSMLEKLPGKPYTDANLMMVCVPDAEGTTTEAAQRRMTHCSSAAESIASEQGLHKFKSALMIDGMLKLVKQNGQQHKARNATFAKLHDTKITRPQFDTMKKDGRLPPDAEMIPGVIKAGPNPNLWRPDYYNGTVFVPGAEQIDRETQNSYQRMLKKLQSPDNGATYAYDRFLKDFYKKAEADQKRLTEFEKDYKGWLLSDARKLLTSHDFDEATHIDGVYYAKCVANVTLGGPMTNEGARWFQPFLTASLNDKESLLRRALFGNQKEFFDWAIDKDQVSKEWDTVKGYMDLEPVKVAITAGKGAVADDARAIMQSLLGTIAAVVSKLDQQGASLSEGLRYQIKLLTMAMMVRSEAGALKLWRVPMPLQDAARLWRVMQGEATNAIRQVANAGKNRVESLLLSSAVAMEANGAAKTAKGVVDVYLIVSQPRTVASKAKQSVINGVRYLAEPAEIYGAKAARSAAQFIDQVTATEWAKGHMKVVTSLNGVLSAGSGLLQVLLIKKAWGDYANGSEWERTGARLSLLSAGLGLTAAFFELRAQYLEHLAKKEAFNSVKRVAGILAAGSTAMDAVQAFINMKKAEEDGDGNAKTGYRVQWVLYTAAAVASGLAAFNVSALGVTATGFGVIGLILVAVGVLVGFVILVIKDKPPEAWAVKTVWGTAEQKWADFAAEEREANKVLLCAQIDFSFRWNVIENLGTSAMAADGAGFFGQEQTYTREAWLRFVWPETLRKRLGWEMRVYASGSNGEKLVGMASYTGSGAVSSALPGHLDGVTPSFSEKSEDGVTTLVLSSTVDMMRFRSARAAVRVFTLSGEGLGAAGARALIIDEEIPG